MNCFLKIVGLMMMISFFTACAHTPTQKASGGLNAAKSVSIPVISMDVQHATASTCPKPESNLDRRTFKELIQFANGCVKANDFSRLQRVGDTIMQREAFQPWGAYFLSLVAQSRGEMPKAHWLIDLAIKKNNSYGLLYYQKGRLAWQDGEHAQGLQWVQKSLQMDPGLIEGHRFLADVYFRDQDFERASEHYFLVLRSYPTDMMALRGLADSRIHRSDHRGALEVLNRWLNHYPSDAQALWRQGQVFEIGMGDSVNALHSYLQLKRQLSRLPGLEIKMTDVEARIERLQKLEKRTPASAKVEGKDQ